MNISEYIHKQEIVVAITNKHIQLTHSFIKLILVLEIYEIDVSTETEIGKILITDLIKKIKELSNSDKSLIDKDNLIEFTKLKLKEEELIKEFAVIINKL